MFRLFTKMLKKQARKKPKSTKPAKAAKGEERDEFYFEVGGDESFSLEIVGEARYQKALDALFGPKTPSGMAVICEAKLVFENSNPDNAYAVAVMINKRKVGYLSREDGIALREEAAETYERLQSLSVQAKIVGGWKRGDDEGLYGVKLDAERPFICE